MKSFTVGIALALCLFVVNANGQNRCNCKDNLICAFRRIDCNNLANKLLCPTMCGMCKGCAPLKPECTSDGSCLDANQFICLLSTPVQRCSIFRNLCRKTCGLCRACNLPAPRLLCTTDCRDNNPNCAHWKKGKHCGPATKFPDVIDLCPKSCGKCVSCKLPPPAPVTPDPIIKKSG